MSSSAAILGDIKVIDTDTHVSEPPDLWVSRVAKKWQRDVPHVEMHSNGHAHWRVGDRWLTPVGFYGQAGWDQYQPSRAVDLEDMDPAAWQSGERLRRMDQYGLYAQVLYPNIIGFEAPLFRDMGPELSVVCVRAYNDFIAEFASADPRRLIPVAMLPFWDQDASVAEMHRWRELGHTAVLFANKLQEVGLPRFHEAYWDPILSTAQDLDISLNFHIGFANYREGMTSAVFGAAGISGLKSTGAPVGGKEGAHDAEDRIKKQAVEDEEFNPRGEVARLSVLPLTLCESIAQTVTSGVCDRYPRLKFVFVESGFGYFPFVLESLDWYWKNYGLARDGKMLPSDYFRRQCYGSFWFEKGTLPLLELYPDNFMFETDFPHPTCLSPGECSAAEVPSVHIQKAFGHLPEDIARKALCTNAAKLYQLHL